MHLASERKIDSIEHRLEDITTLLKDIKTHGPTTRDTDNAESEASHPPIIQPSVLPYQDQSHPSETARTTVVEGDSSLSAHSVFVNNFLQTFVGSKPSDPEIQMTMDSLSHIADASSKKPQARESVLPNARVPRHKNQTKFDLPPIQSVVTLIRKAEGAYSNPLEAPCLETCD